MLFLFISRIRACHSHTPNDASFPPIIRPDFTYGRSPHTSLFTDGKNNMIKQKQRRILGLEMCLNFSNGRNISLKQIFFQTIKWNNLSFNGKILVKEILCCPNFFQRNFQLHYNSLIVVSWSITTVIDVCHLIWTNFLFHRSQFLQFDLI